MVVSAGIPLIDINSADHAAIGRQLVDAAEEHGFIYIRNLGKDITPEQVDQAFGISRKFFDVDVEEKQKCAITTQNRGWSRMGGETLDPKNQRVGDFKEAFNIGPFKDHKLQQPLPASMASDEAKIEEIREACNKLCLKLLLLLGEGLGIGDFFSSAHIVTEDDAAASILRLLRYPPPDATAHSEADVRAGAHSDYGSITLLFRLKGQAGLEVQLRDDTWAPVPVCPPGTEDDPSPPILINIGDMLSYWTNGLFRSTVHRVVFGNNNIAGEESTQPRYSIAFFSHPAGSTELGVVPSERVKNFVPRGQSSNPFAEKKVMTADEHLHMRLAATYGDLYKKKEQAA